MSNSLEEVVRAAIESYLMETHTSIPAIVETVNNDSTVNATVAVQRVLVSDEKVTVPTLAKVPVSYFGNSDFEITFPLKKGDEGVILFSERDISRFIKNGGISSPTVLRMHEYSDAVFIPSSLSNGKRTSVSGGGIKISDKQNGFNIEISSGNGVVISNQSGTNKIELTNAGINLFGLVKFESIPGSGNADTTLSTHVHPTAGTGAPSPPTPGS